jgi:hypothetical protein
MSITCNVEYDKHGLPSKITNYLDGKKHGIETTYSYGSIRSITTYKNGLRHGEYKKYDNVGSRMFLSVEGFYEDNQKHIKFHPYFTAFSIIVGIKRERYGAESSKQGLVLTSISQGFMSSSIMKS